MGQQQFSKVKKALKEEGEEAITPQVGRNSAFYNSGVRRAGQAGIISHRPEQFLMGFVK